MPTHQTKVIAVDIDNVYYECTVPNTGNISIPAKVFESRTEPILYNSNNWQVQIADFNLSANQIPIFVFEDALPDYSAGYFITLKYAAAGTTPLTTGVPSPVIYSPYQIATNATYPYNRAIYNYTLFLEQVNNAINVAWSDAAIWTALGITEPLPPYISYDPSTTLFSIVYPQDVVSELLTLGTANISGGNRIQICMNQRLYKFFKFPATELFTPASQSTTPPIDVILRFTTLNQRQYPIPNTFPDEYGQETMCTTSQEYPTITKWLTYTKLLFQTNSIPVMTRSVYDTTNVGNDQKFSVLTTYEISDNEIFDRSNIVKGTNSDSRWISLLPSGVVKTIDIQVQLMGKTSNDILQTYIAPGEKMSMTLWFSRKVVKTFDLDVYEAVTGLGPVLRRSVEELGRAFQEDAERRRLEAALEETRNPGRIVPRKSTR